MEANNTNVNETHAYPGKHYTDDIYYQQNTRGAVQSMPITTYSYFRGVTFISGNKAQWMGSGQFRGEQEMRKNGDRGVDDASYCIIISK